MREKKVGKNGNEVDYREYNEISSVESFSWRVYTDDVIIKRMDKSCFFHRGTGIPIDIRDFFRVVNLEKSKKITLIFNGVKYIARIEADKVYHRTRMFWHSDFARAIDQIFPEWAQLFVKNEIEQDDRPDLRFERKDMEEDTYDVQLIDPKIIQTDIDNQDENESTDNNGVVEGRVKFRNSKFYERNLTNRREAIRIHGTKCSVCGFDFEETYGEVGHGFIEIHHIQPLSEFDSERKVNPKIDLVPVCSNCHRMIHRDPKNILTVEEL